MVRDGILFIGDTKGAALFAIDTGDHATVAEKHAVELKDVSGKIAAMLGSDPKQIAINDLAVNPLSGNVYVSVSRGRGPDASPLLVRIHADGKVEEVSLENIPFAKAELPNVPGAERQRAEAITDLSFADGRVFVAGLSNEEFSSRLIAIPFPFSSGGFDAAAIEIYHGAHGKFETKSPIRTFVTYRINNEPYMLAAYQCTPLVKLPVADLKAGAHVKGMTIAELGNRNRPLDMIVYQKDGKDYLLMTNSSRGVMKIPDRRPRARPRVSPSRFAAAASRAWVTKRSPSIKGAVQMDQLDNHHAVLLVQENPNGAMDLEDDRIAVIFRRWLKAIILVLAGANSSFGEFAPAFEDRAVGSAGDGRRRRRSHRDRSASCVEACDSSSSESRCRGRRGRSESRCDP